MTSSLVPRAISRLHSCGFFSRVWCRPNRPGHWESRKWSPGRFQSEIKHLGNFRSEINHLGDFRSESAQLGDIRPNWAVDSDLNLTHYIADLAFEITQELYYSWISYIVEPNWNCLRAKPVNDFSEIIRWLHPQMIWTISNYGEETARVPLVAFTSAASSLYRSNCPGHWKSYINTMTAIFQSTD